MLLKEWFEVLKTPKLSFRDACKQYDISERKMRAFLNDYYDFDQSNKTYNYKGNGDEPLEENVYSFAASKNYKPQQQPAEEPNINKTYGGNMERILEEILKHTKSIDSALTAQPAKKEVAASIEEPAPASVMQRVYELQLDKNKTRKTLTLNATAGKMLDEFAAANGLDKSAIASIALLEFFERNK